LIYTDCQVEHVETDVDYQYVKIFWQAK